MSLTRQELHDLAAAGAAARVADMERQLAVLHKEWPELFLSKTTPVLLAASLKASAPTNGNGHWPAVLRQSPSDVAVRDQQILAFIAQHPDGVAPVVVKTSLQLQRSATDAALRKLAAQGRLRLVSRGRYAVGSATDAPPPKARKRVVWSAAMRRAAAKRMRARHADPAFQKALAKSRRGRKARA